MTDTSNTPDPAPPTTSGSSALPELPSALLSEFDRLVQNYPDARAALIPAGSRQRASRAAIVS